MELARALVDLWNDRASFREAAAGGSARALASMLGPAWRGLVRRRGREGERTSVAVNGDASFDWQYRRTFPELARLYDAAKASQWDAGSALDWSRPVDPRDPARPLLPHAFLPVSGLPQFQRASAAEQAQQVHAMRSSPGSSRSSCTASRARSTPRRR